MASDAGAAALDALDRVLARRPHADEAILSEAAKALSLLRNERAAGADRAVLGHVNAVISLVLAAHYPLGEVPWPELEQGRSWLAQVVQTVAFSRRRRRAGGGWRGARDGGRSPSPSRPSPASARGCSVSSVTGVVTIVAEGRFQLTDDHGVARLFVLGPNAAADTSQLAPLQHCQARVRVRYRSAPNAIGDIATAIDLAD